MNAIVIDDTQAPVHVSGYASQDEQKLMLSLLHPKNFIQVHGELRQLKHHAWLAGQVGIPSQNIFVVENGQIVELENGKVNLGDCIPGDYIVVEGSNIGDADPDVMREPEQLARSGILVINLSIDKRSDRVIEDPEIITYGFVSADDVETLVPTIRERVKDVIQRIGMRVEKDMLGVVRTFIFDETKRRPMVFVTVTKV
jgi:ribonuclease J